MVGMAQLSAEELETEAGVNWDRVFAGGMAEGATLLALALAPEVTVPAELIAYGISAVSGAYTGYGFAS
ncbi:hypothetical protein [Alicyclobacillus acidiphilus]|uniref:hypothetical protein n=1 Tax=Alicyclobacillus acidiphilus TaxID=182455 RepID=UPI00082B91A7|nr:hypothetical protein [Alicyclobacillus acidiphilus]